MAERAQVQRGVAVPMWRQIETDLAFEIRAGFYGSGDKLPSEAELSERYGVHRHTVRLALAHLAERGLVVSRQGKGVFVASGPLEYLITRDSKWSEIEQRLAAAPGGRLVASHGRHASDGLAVALGVPPGCDLTVIESVRSAAPDVAAYGYHMFETTRFPDIAAKFAASRSFTLALADYGHDRFFRASTWIDCRMPRPREADELGIALDAPVLVMAYVDCDAGGRPIFYANAVIPNGRLLLRVDTR